MQGDSARGTAGDRGQDSPWGRHCRGVPTRLAGFAAKSLSTEDMPALSRVTFYLQVDDPQAVLDSSISVGGKAIVQAMEKVPGRGSTPASGPAEKAFG